MRGFIRQCAECGEQFTVAWSKDKRRCCGRKCASVKRTKDPQLKKIGRAFSAQRYGAKCRGVPFLLTFEEWVQIWEQSGHLHERGNKRGQYVMARPGDKGPYAIGNVRITLAEVNAGEMKLSPEGRARIAASSRRLKGVPKPKGHGHKVSLAQKGRPGKPHTPESKAKISAANKGRASPKSPEHRKKLSEAIVKVFADPDKWRKYSEAQKRRWAKWRESNLS